MKENPIFRICPEAVRSPRAFASWEGRNVVNVPAVLAEKPDDKRSREQACSRAHANALAAFLSTPHSHGVIMEDDVILKDPTWLSFTDFDLFHPFQSSRFSLPVDNTVVEGFRPSWGAIAYVVSRAFASAYAGLLQLGGITDHVDKQAAAGLRVGHFAGNAVDHDNECSSCICEARRQWWLGKINGGRS